VENSHFKFHSLVTGSQMRVFANQKVVRVFLQITMVSMTTYVYSAFTPRAAPRTHLRCCFAASLSIDATQIQYDDDDDALKSLNDILVCFFVKRKTGSLMINRI
jgi:hypothetical protein